MSQSMGYDFAMSDATVRKYRGTLNSTLEELNKFQKAMREDQDTILAAGGTISVQRLKAYYLGQTNASGDIKLASAYMNRPNELADTLPHEHTHNLMHALITRELGFKAHSSEFYKAYFDAVIEHSINTEALEKYKKYLSREHTKAIKDFTPYQDIPQIKTKIKRAIEDARKQIADINAMTIEQAAKKSGMRDYALEQYAWAPKGHYIEMPTVATEHFVKSGYNFKTLLKNSPYSYFVLQTVYSRIHKGDSKKKKKK